MKNKHVYISIYSVVTLLLLNFHSFSQAQLAYTSNQFSYDSIVDISYGIDTDYAGNLVDLKLDIYKPISDFNCMRPLILLVHGGAWVGGSKEDQNIVLMAREFAKKGWVAATINYRLGNHKAANYSMYALCNNSISAPCGYICDSSEIIRANFRAMQDVKGAVRFMKNRNDIDSTDINNVFLAGESAGGFISFAAAFTDQENEKSESCFAINEAPIPDADFYTYGCIPTNNNRSRPDLGSIEGSLNLGASDANVNGIGSFYGATFNLSIVNQLSEPPCLYIYHQGSDIVVNYEYARVLGRTSWECYAQTNLCQSYLFYPFAFGNKSIKNYLSGLSSNPILYQADIIENYSYLNNCFSNGHSIDLFALRVQNMTNLFANRIALSINNPQNNCNPTLNDDLSKDEKSFILFPNPATNQLTVFANSQLQGLSYVVYNIMGESVLKGIIHSGNTQIDLSNLSSGMYFFNVGVNCREVFIVIKE